jgi:hypothetical protein
MNFDGFYKELMSIGGSSSESCPPPGGVLGEGVGIERVLRAVSGRMGGSGRGFHPVGTGWYER